jgi:hypothetical protein
MNVNARHRRHYKSGACLDLVPLWQPRRSTGHRAANLEAIVTTPQERITAPPPAAKMNVFQRVINWIPGR